MTKAPPLALRTPESSPFAILYKPRSIPDSAKPAKKTGPKLSRVQQAVISLETPAERRARQLQMNSAPTFNVPIATQKDSVRTAKIKGRAL